MDFYAVARHDLQGLMDGIQITDKREAALLIVGREAHFILKTEEEGPAQERLDRFCEYLKALVDVSHQPGDE